MKFHVMTDHHLLIHLLKQLSLSRQQAQWTEFLANFDLQFRYFKGEDNTLVDSLLQKNLEEDSDRVDVHIFACVAALTEFFANISPALQEKIIAGCTQDSWCQALQWVLP